MLISYNIVFIYNHIIRFLYNLSQIHLHFQFILNYLQLIDPTINI